MATLSPPRAGSVGDPQASARPGGPAAGRSGLIALALLSPLVLVALDAHSAGWGEIHRALFRARSVMLLRHTVVLAAVVSVLAAVIGTAWRG